MRFGLSAGLDPKSEKERDCTGLRLKKSELIALAVQRLEAKKAEK